MRHLKPHATNPPAAGNGLLGRRAFVTRVGLSTASAPLLLAAASGRAADEPLTKTRYPGTAMSPYGSPSAKEADVVRQRIRSAPGTTGSGASGTPLQHLRGTLTPSGLHFERHHSGIPAIDPSEHRLTIAGAVKRPLRFDLETLHRYPMITRTQFLECSGNSAVQLQQKPPAFNCADIHGLVSSSEWTGVPLRALLEEAGVSDNSKASWVIAEGADAARMNRSIPLAKCMDDALIALYQNGERLRPENGYPMRLFLPGFEGNMSIKWLHRLEVSEQPAMSREETSKYTDLRPGGQAVGFTFEMGVKSVITSPSPGLDLTKNGVYQITGLAWSGAGSIAKVEVSADGGKSWVNADFETPPTPRNLARFTTAWNWQGQPAMLLSRATDSAGQTQPTREVWIDQNGANSFYHYNAIQAWKVLESGQLENTYVA